MPIPPDMMAAYDKNLDLEGTISFVLSECGEVGIDVSHEVERLLNILTVGTPKHRDVHKALEFLLQTVYKELERSVCLRVPSSATRYYGKANLFGDKVATKFKAVRKDIEEAGNCFATGRYTATVFHLMRVMEVGVQRLGKKLSVLDTKEKDWHGILNGINGALNNKYRNRKLTAKEKATRDKYAQAVALLTNVKDAWRNRVMHPKASYDDREAERVLRAVESYMQYIAGMV